MRQKPYLHPLLQVLEPNFALLGSDASRLTISPLTNLDAQSRTLFPLHGSAECTDAASLIGECQPFETLFCAGGAGGGVGGGVGEAGGEALVLSLCEGAVLQRYGLGF